MTRPIDAIQKAIDSGSQLVNLPVSQLALDPENPRLPEELLGGTQDELLAWLEQEEVLDELARSMLENGFFQHEPLVVLPQNGESEKHYVVEGNRRLAALSILLQLPAAKKANLEFAFSSNPSSEQLDRLRDVPCFVVPDRDEVRKFLGFRHIGGLKTWSPESKARYIEFEVEQAIAGDSNEPFREVARRVGSTAPAVRGQYLALKTLRAARDLGVDSRHIIRERFGVWNRLLNSPDIRSYIGLGNATTADDVRSLTDNLNRDGLAQVVSDLTPAESGVRPVLWDSRDVTVYGKVIADDRARESLMKFGDLSVARQIVERGAVTERLRSLARTVEAITQDIDSYDIDYDVEVAAEGLFNNARTLRSAVRDRLKDDADD